MATARREAICFALLSLRAQREYLDGLARLHLEADAEARRGLWRQTMATLAAEAADHRPIDAPGSR